MGLIKPDDRWRLPDEVWQQMESLLPARKAHALGCHNPRVSDRAAMNAIVLVLRNRAQWNALNATGICSSSAAHRRFQEWGTGVRVRGVLACGPVVGASIGRD